ncbi:hypothetical protein, partial [Clostridium saccharoperbutylacetonicum]|uniref:hypothetical protein n=1 Tax=Clostridium saccharoperbutylacetonicum TaxID=36745 RepID=UPI0039EA3145
MNKRIKNMLIILIILGISVGAMTKIYINKTEKNDNKIELPSYVNNIVINEDFFNNMSEKERVNYKILNSIDFFKNATGKYIYTDKISNYTELIKYCVDTENRQSYVSIISDDGNINEEIIYKNNIKKEIDNIKKLY